MEFLAVPSITCLTPEQQIDRSCVRIPSNIKLADPEFHKPAQIQLLIGAGTSLSILSVGLIRLSGPNEPELILQKTQLGWIIGGSWPSLNKENLRAKNYLLNTQDDMSKFWEIEDIQSTSKLSVEESACEEHFVKNYRRDSDGRYVIKLPFNDKLESLGESYHRAFKRLQSLNRKFKANETFRVQYTKVLEDYIAAGFLEEVKEDISNGFFLPHQAVIKESSMTSKVRIVYDASAKSNSGVSLNDALLAGPKLQDDIFSLLVRFRLHAHVLTGDIEKMYLQVVVDKNDRKYLCILWMGKDGTIKIFQFKRLPFGIKPASFLATRCLKQLALDYMHLFPLAARILLRDLYVDDLLSGADTIEEVIQLREQLTQLLTMGGFNIRQYASNTSEVLQTIPSANINLQLQDNDDATLKTLGVYWHAMTDKIIYTVEPISLGNVTKRTIFSEVAKIYDPLGLLNPVIVTAKLLIQELWKLELDWDEKLTGELYTKWKHFSTQLPALNDITFARRCVIMDPCRIELHGFCDASEKAYGACIYLRSVDSSGQIYVQLYCAKSRVAPIKNVQTIPRLELCAALLLASLYKSVRESIHLKIDQNIFWSDSMIALYWIRTEPCQLKTFVSRRVAEIQEKTNLDDWRHVRTYDNPADLLSRGVSPADFKDSCLWLKGPVWLCEREENWPVQQWTKPSKLPEVRKPKCLITTHRDASMFERFSSFLRLQRSIAYCFRVLSPFSHDQKSLKKEELSAKRMLTMKELAFALIRILSIVQGDIFKDELSQLKKNESVHKKSNLACLNPFIDKDGLIRVGGRLQNSDYTYSKKHPIVLPKNHVTRLIILHEHIHNYHAGLQATLCAVRQKYWPIDGRNQVRQVLRSCVTCTRAKPVPVNYPMGQLPKVRTQVSRPFANTGVDYCGPFFIKEKKFRNRNKIKIYVSVFICLSTKAIHLEVVSDLTTEAFLAALKRFIARRGKCLNIYSDNGTNFVGANNELKKIYELLKSTNHNKDVYDYLSTEGTHWHFNPPLSPHFGGLWESAVKSFKYHLRRVVGISLFTFEQFNTFVIEIESILNSRPLTPLSCDPNDLNVLTPAHFLIGDTLLGLPEYDLLDTPDNRLSIWQHIQKVKQDFWKRWYKEYINELNIRHKWLDGEHIISPGVMVTIRDDNIPPMQWKFGRVIEVFPGPDGVSRVAKLRTAKGEFVRNVKKLAPLPIEVKVPIKN